MDKPRPQEVYRHFKGNLYQIITLARHTETEEELVIYQAMYGDFRIFARPLHQFLSPVDVIKYPDAGQKYRFQLMRPVSEELRKPPVREPAPGFLRPEAAPTEEGILRSPEAEGAKGGVSQGIMDKTIEEEARELHMDPRVIAFLDADTIERRIAIVDDLHATITNEMIDVMSMAIDCKIDGTDPEERYHVLRDFLKTRQRFESNRLRS